MENECRNPQLQIDSAHYLTDYTIRIKFNNGSEKLVDFQPFLSSSLHPSIRKYLDKNLFQAFIIHEGNLNWKDYDLIFPISDLYEGKI